MSYEALTTRFNSIAQDHSTNPARYYFGEGDKKVVQKCEIALSELRLFRDKTFLTDEDAIPKHPLFPYFKKHMDQIKVFYSEHETDLLILFLREIIPSHCFPLRFEILRSMSLCSAMVVVHEEKFSPSPIPAHVDGYYNFTVPIADNDLRIPLIPEDLQTPATFPPSIRFFSGGKEFEEKQSAEDTNRRKTAPKLFIIDQAPTIGRVSQLHSFISILSKHSPRCGMRQLLSDAIASFDITFATAICSLCYSETTIKYIGMTLNFLGVEGCLDHFLRSLSCAIRGFVRGTPSIDYPEFAALINIFVACASPWAGELELEDGKGLTGLVTTICYDLQKRLKVPSIAYYILKVALTVAAYEDPTGDAALAMFFELVIYTFAWKFDLYSDFKLFKQAIIDKKSKNVQAYRKLIEDTIVQILGISINVSFSRYRVILDEKPNDLDDIYQFLIQNADPFVRLVIVLNSRKEIESPALQSVLFSYQKGLENALFGAAGDPVDVTNSYDVYNLLGTTHQ